MPMELLALAGCCFPAVRGEVRVGLTCILLELLHHLMRNLMEVKQTAAGIVLLR